MLAQMNIWTKQQSGDFAQSHFTKFCSFECPQSIKRRMFNVHNSQEQINLLAMYAHVRISCSYGDCLHELSFR